jgi:hypothetical protein
VAFVIFPYCDLRAASQLRDRVDDLGCCHNRAGVVGQVDIESGVHHFIGVIRRCISYNGDFVAELSGEPNRCFDAGMRDEPDDDELMDAVSLEQQI